MKKSKKRWMTLFCFYVLFLFVLSGCYIAVEEEEEKKSETDRVMITICDYPRMGYRDKGRFGYVKERIKAFEKENPGVYVNLVTMEGKDDFLTMEQVPDILPLTDKEESFALCQPITEYVEEQKLKEAALSIVKQGEEYYGYPVYMAAPVLVYHKKMLQERGLAIPKGNRLSYDDLMTYIEALTLDIDQDGKTDVYGLSMPDIESDHILNLVIATRDKKEENLTEESKMRIKKLAMRKDCLHPGFGKEAKAVVLGRFRKEEAAMISADISMLKTLKEEGVGFGVLFFPGSDTGGEAVQKPFSDAFCAYGISKEVTEERKKEMCVKLIKKLAGEEGESLLKGEYVVLAQKGFEEPPKTDLYYFEQYTLKSIFLKYNSSIRKNSMPLLEKIIS